MTVDLLTTSYYTGARLAEIRGTLPDVYADVYAEDIATSASRWPGATPATTSAT